MSNEWEKMLNGEPYDAANTEFIDRLFKTHPFIVTMAVISMWVTISFQTST